MSIPRRTQVSVMALIMSFVFMSTAGSVSAGSSTVVGAATALQATVLGATTAFASTGNLVDSGDARNASALSGMVPAVASADVLSATTISSILQWDLSDNVSSAASLADLAVTAAGATISAGFAMAGAFAPVGGAATGWSTLTGLAINGVPVALTGTENETISIPGLTIVANEVLRSASGVTVNALHIISSNGLVDVVVASATAGIQ